MYSVKLKTFEGPLELLLHLVDKSKLDITEISLASICREYREYLMKLRELDLEIESSFLTVFASLLEIKSRLLLPVPPSEEEEDKEPPEHELVTRLKEYRSFKIFAGKLARMSETVSASFPRVNMDEMDALDAPVITTQVSANDLMDIYVSVMRKMNRQSGDNVVEIPCEKVSFPLIFKIISRKIRSRLSTSLLELFDSPPDKVQFIMTFLVLLEMARRRKINLVQENEEDIIRIINRRQLKRRNELELAG